MKKTKLFGLALIAAMSSFTACTNEAEEVLSQGSKISLTSEITPSRVISDLQSTQLEEGRTIGVTITGSKSGDNYVNKPWTSDGEGGLSTTHTVYWANTDINVTAYHPYEPNWTSGIQTFTVQTDQSVEENYLDSDLLWAKETEVSKSTNAIPLTFSHKLAKVNVTLQPEYPEMDLSSAVISICNTITSTTIDLSDGTVPEEATGEVQEIKAGVGSSASAIVAPQTIAASTKFIKIELGEKTFYYTLSAEKQLKSGYSHNYTLTVKETAVQVENSSEIENWTPDNDEENTGDANEEGETLLLPDGQTFNQIIGNVLSNNTNLKKIKFIVKSDKTSETILVTDVDGTVGYIVENGEYLEIHSSAEEFIANSSCTSMFAGSTPYETPSLFNNIVSIDFGKNFNTENVTDMSSMFRFCEALTSLNVSNFNTESVTSMSNMFHFCSELTSLNVSNFNTENVTDMNAMFEYCEALTSLNVSNFNTENVTNMGFMFSGCLALTSLNLSNFNTGNVTYMEAMFQYCSALTSLNISNFDTENVTDMGFMFSGCSALISLNVSNFNTENVTDMSYMFQTCSALTSLNVSNFNTENVTNMSGMFNVCSALTSLNVSNFNTENVTDMAKMFQYCSALTSLNLSNFNTENVTNMGFMFNECSALTFLNLSNFNTGNVTDMSCMFQNCSALTPLNVSNFNTENVTNMKSMFNGCTALTSLDVSNFNTVNVTDMSYMFQYCRALTSLDVSNFNTVNVTNMKGMFGLCYALTSLDISNFNTEDVTDMNRMFYECTALTSLDISNFNTENVTNMSYMFYDCLVLPSLNVSNFNTENVTNMSYMFENCLYLTSLDLLSFSFENNVSTTNMFLAVGSNVYRKPISIKVTPEAYTYLTETTKDCNIGSNNAKFVKSDGSDW